MRFDLTTLNLVLAIAGTRRALVRHVRHLRTSPHALDSEVVEFARGIKGHLRIAAGAGAISDCLPPRTQEVLPTVVQRFVDAVCGQSQPEETRT